ncbi:MAG: hypothetical protein ACPL7K_01465 [Armatimonadota bacterium]
MPDAALELCSSPEQASAKLPQLDLAFDPWGYRLGRATQTGDLCR